MILISLLLGVSLTGIMDHKQLSGSRHLAQWLKELKEVAIETNKEWSDKLGISPSCAITCVKPSGTVSQLVDSSSGIHPRYSAHYIRTVRADKKDPLARLMRDGGFPVEDSMAEPTQDVFSFPHASPNGSVLRNDRTAIQQLEHWLIYQLHWCEHKPSVTIYVRKDEWMEVGAWVWEHFDDLSGVSFLPYDHSETIYPQMPYTECSKEEYEEFLLKMPQDMDWSRISEYEDRDNTISSQAMACSGDTCEVVDL